MEVYVAFSIHGTNCFITAKKQVESVVELGPEFSVGQSRRPDYLPSVATKLNWSGLINREGKPYRSPAHVMMAFKKLEQRGWEVFKENFVKKHWPKHA